MQYTPSNTKTIGKQTKNDIQLSHKRENQIMWKETIHMMFPSNNIRQTQLKQC